jgi:ssDNA-binding Zn-finger/Zn-ribbon topoisomerase 1
VKPCDEPCPKCGSADIHRLFHKRNSLVERPNLKYGVAPLEKYIGGSGFHWYATRDLIAHHCRTCQHEWASKALAKRTADTSSEVQS